MADTSRPDDTPQPVLAATPARQGRFGRHMFWVLVAGTLLAALGLFLAWTWKAPDLSRADAQRTSAHAAAAPAYDAPAPAPATQQKGPNPTAP
ncbi:MAG TPA: hypothetical protein VNW53_04690 [Phenylobacterium sp.]|jgi:hypothetical protein|uniref:hypothetical protein n=1 Tax=Phenylobacterium sp. TaxID=1871053 RepID=UPI002C018176|nr:hypothetical protein [Phenylobacterium sp.]HXA38276.1 hypothetical protein [Phenylobacterium sp.]